MYPTRLPTSASKPGLQMRAYLALRPLLQPLMRRLVKRRVRIGKDDPARSVEKLGIATQPRPDGRLVWVHAVGLGEVLALRPLLAQMQAEAPDISFLITSTARSSAKVLDANLPPRSQHQFLPLDGPDFMRKFLDHWRPDLSIWSEQDLWPGAIEDTYRRGIPLAYINARMNAASTKRRAKLAGLHADMLNRFAFVAAQNGETQSNLRALGAHDPQRFKSLKPAAAPLDVDTKALAHFQSLTTARKIWVAASTHAADEEVVIAAQKILATQDPTRLLILVPRVPDRAPQIATALRQANLSFAQRSTGQDPAPQTSVLLADSFGELGLWYRLSQIAFVGASFAEVGGHNPWEPACLGLPVLYGPNVQNFANDYTELTEAGVAQPISLHPDATQNLADAVTDGARAETQTKAAQLISEARAAIAPLATALLLLLKPQP